MLKLLHMILIIVPCSLCLFFSALADPQIQPHRAIYDLNNRSLDNDRSLLSVTGRMIVELSHTCESFLLNQRMVLNLIDGAGKEKIIDFRSASSEKRDGKNFRFALENYINGTLSKRESGTARLFNVGKKGLVTFDQPPNLSRNLPVGTSFPVTSNTRVLKAALAGKTRIQDIIFNGSVDGLYITASYIRTIIGEKIKASARFPLLNKLESWTVQTAYYPHGSFEEIPELETSFRLYGNGVSDNLSLDFGDFLMSGKLSQLTALKDSKC